jgi:hypothetical protein
MNGRISRETERRGRKFHLFEAIMAVGVILLAMAGWWGYARYYQNRIPPEQPIPFSHRVHAHDKQIGCLVCHDSATWSWRAGIPPLQTCMLCHERVAIHYPPIAKLREHYFNNEPVQWVRVNWVNEFVYFPHFMHLQAGIDCGTCHGNVRMMDRVGTVHPFQMGFCIECHRKNGATTDCFTCHR